MVVGEITFLPLLFNQDAERDTLYLDVNFYRFFILMPLFMVTQ